jgi:hypothetical protein
MRYYSLARWALVEAFRACGVGQGDRVLLPELICREVLAAVHVLGAVAVLYPVARQLCPACDADDMPDAAAVLAVNYFGFPQDLTVFRRYCQRTGAVLIEDNAHGFLSRDPNGELLGSRGAAGVFSFRKTIAVSDGGALVFNDDRVIPGAACSPARGGGGARYQVKQAFRRVTKTMGPVRTLRTIQGLRLLRRFFTGHALPPRVADAEVRIALPPSASAMLGHPIAVADQEAEVSRRRSLYGLAGRIVREIVGILPVFRQLPPNVAPYGFPIFVSSTQLSRVSDDVGRWGLQVSQWPDLPSSVAPTAPAHYRELAVLPFLW